MTLTRRTLFNISLGAMFAPWLRVFRKPDAFGLLLRYFFRDAQVDGSGPYTHTWVFEKIIKSRDGGGLVGWSVEAGEDNDLSIEHPREIVVAMSTDVTDYS